MKEISAQLLIVLKKRLDEVGLTRKFKEWKKDHGTVSPTLATTHPLCEGTVPHPVHFREGRQVRNLMRQSGLCEGWDSHDFDENWKRAVEMAIEGE